MFKLEQINAKERILRPGVVCVDLGSSPGSWSQLATKLVGPGGRVVAVDVLPMEPLPGVEFVLGDLTSNGTIAALRAALGDSKVDLVMSDMAPNISGTRAMDQPRSLALIEEALAFAEDVLKPGGTLLLKAFQGEGIDEFVRFLGTHFESVKRIKPKASRAESREIYLLARNHGMV